MADVPFGFGVRKDLRRMLRGCPTALALSLRGMIERPGCYGCGARSHFLDSCPEMRSDQDKDLAESCIFKFLVDRISQEMMAYARSSGKAYEGKGSVKVYWSIQEVAQFAHLYSLPTPSSPAWSGGPSGPKGRAHQGSQVDPVRRDLRAEFSEPIPVPTRRAVPSESQRAPSNVPRAAQSIAVRQSAPPRVQQQPFREARGSRWESWREQKRKRQDASVLHSSKAPDRSVSIIQPPRKTRANFEGSPQQHSVLPDVSGIPVDRESSPLSSSVEVLDRGHEAVVDDGRAAPAGGVEEVESAAAQARDRNEEGDEEVEDLGTPSVSQGLSSNGQRKPIYEAWSLAAYMLRAQKARQSFWVDAPEFVRKKMAGLIAGLPEDHPTRIQADKKGWLAQVVSSPKQKPC